ncbi:MAG: thioredoxin family protein [Anaerolineales bacterium]|nr:thioredoxin family protein [Anaerolineales bacterium]
MNLIPVGYSFVAIAIGFTIITGIILLTNKPKWNDYAAFTMIVIGLFIAWGIIHPRETLLQKGSQEVQSLIGSGTPVLLEFQSPYCIACISIKPMVDELEKELNGQFIIGKQIHVVRLNIQDEVGMDLAPIYGFAFTPTFIYFDADGNELWRMVGTFDPQKVRDSLIQ